VVDLSLSSNEEYLIPDTSRDFEFAQCLYCEFNHAFLGPLADDKIIILSNCDEKKEQMCEKSTSAEVASAPAAVNPASSTSTDDVDAPVEAKNNSSDSQGLIRSLAVETAAKMIPARLRLPR
jgi:hypothetical protein